MGALPAMKVVSVNVGLPRIVQWKGETVSTAIFKEPVAGRITLRFLNFAGDAQSDLSVHGGRNKAVYVYPMEHYAYWRQELPDMALPWGMFGENLTTAGMWEDAVWIGSRFRIGSSEVVVAEPRMPCYKLALRFGREDMVKRFLASGRTGFYCAVLKEGEVEAGDPIAPIGRDENAVPVSEITRLYAHDTADMEALRRASELAALPEDWRDHFKKQIGRLAAGARRRTAAP